jgi:hypothetical protein
MRLCTLVIVTLSAVLWCGCGGSSGSCTGAATACASIAYADCAQQGGCDATQSCDGLASPCFGAADVGACGARQGCSWDQVCGGTATACTPQATSAACEAIPGCTWYQSYCNGTSAMCLAQSTAADCGATQGCTWYEITANCGGTPPPCYTLTIDPSNGIDQCSPQPGCTINGSCIGSAASCVGIEADKCATQSGCTLHEACAGTATVCAEFEKQAECAAQAGCAWQK